MNDNSDMAIEIAIAISGFYGSHRRLSRKLLKSRKKFLDKCQVFLGSGKVLARFCPESRPENRSDASP
jgi:hypothetical protein